MQPTLPHMGDTTDDAMSLPHVMTSPSDVERFIFAGNAVFTLRSQASGTHYTFKMTQADASDTRPRLWFVSLLTGPRDFTYMGVVRPGHMGQLQFSLTKASKFNHDTTPVQAFDWFLQNIVQLHRIHKSLEVRHEGHCGRCNRPLTHPTSIDRGIGPDCWEAMGGDPFAGGVNG
jgi:hypothetical protein